MPNGNLETPVVGAWSTTLPTSWTWTAGPGAGAVGLTGTGGANGSQQCLYGNQIAGNLTSGVLPQVLSAPGVLTLSYWTKRLNTGPFTLRAALLVNGSEAAFHSDVIAFDGWVKYTMTYAASSTAVGKSLAIKFTFSDGSGAWQGYLDEIQLDYAPASVRFAGSSVVQPEVSPTGLVSVILNCPLTNTVTVNYFRAGGTALAGTDFSFTPGTLTFSPGVVSNSFSFAVSNNATYEALKTIVFGLSNVVNALPGGITNYTVSIVDPEDRPAVNVGFGTAGAMPTETSGANFVSVLLTAPTTNTVTLKYYRVGGTAVAGTDFSFAPGTLTFNPGSVSNSFPFTINNDATYQASKTVVFGLSNAVNAALDGITNYTVTIVDPEDRPAPTTYYVDSVSGNNAQNGTTINTAWKTLAKPNATTFKSGDHLLLKAGSVWTGQLHPLGSGDINGQVTIDSYGTGAQPVINGGGISGGAIYLLNQQYWSINNLEVSNYGSTNVAKKQGILIKNDCVGTLNSIYVRNCYVHDVNGTMDSYSDGKESGGIVFNITSSNTNVPSKWHDLRIENNLLRDVAREGILLQSFWVNKPADPNVFWSGLGNYYPSTQVRIASNTLERISGDGIIPWAVNGGMVEYNSVRQSNLNPLGQAHAAIWPYICENVIFQYNEASETKNKYDGMAFDFDNSNLNCIYQYNYSHDNEGGFLNMCSGGSSSNNIARYNLSQNDGCLAGSRVFTIYGPGNHNNSVYNNTVYVCSNNPVVFQDDGGGSSASSINFHNNIFINQGTGAVYAPGGCVFDNNLYYGNGSIGGDAHKLLLNPQLVGAGSASNGLASVTGYKLQTNSPALSAGILITNNGGRDYWGNAVSASSNPNIGAYNFTGVPELPPTLLVGWSATTHSVILFWPANCIGWQLIVQTNNLNLGVSSNPADWAVVIGSNNTNGLVIPNDSIKPAQYYRLKN